MFFFAAISPFWRNLKKTVRQSWQLKVNNRYNTYKYYFTIIYSLLVIIVPWHQNTIINEIYPCNEITLTNRFAEVFLTWIENFTTETFKTHRCHWENKLDSVRWWRKSKPVSSVSYLSLTWWTMVMIKPTTERESPTVEMMFRASAYL